MSRGRFVRLCRSFRPTVFSDGVNRSAVAVDSLEGLVDLAIDTDRRVLEAADGTCYVFGSERTYTYDPPRPPDEDLLPPGSAGSAGPSQDGAPDPSSDGDDAPDDAVTDGRETDVVDAEE